MAAKITTVYEALQDQFNRVGEEMADAREAHEARASWDTEKRLNQVRILADAILDQALEAFPELAHAEIIDVPEVVQSGEMAA